MLPLGVNSPDYPDPWYLKCQRRALLLVPTLTQIAWARDFRDAAFAWTRTESTVTAAIRGNGTSTSLQAGATAGSIASINTASPIVENIRTDKWALFARVAKIATDANADLRIIDLTDIATGSAQLGMDGPTSAANYTLQSGAGLVNTGIAQSAVGVYDTIAMYNDGTNLKADINFAAAGAGIAVATVPATFGLIRSMARTTAPANNGYRIKNLILLTVPGT